MSRYSGYGRYRAKMPIAQRAKQFMPYKSVSGLGAALRKKEHELGQVSRPELSPDAADEIDRVLGSLRSGDEVSVKYYSRGRYETVRSRVRCVNPAKGELELKSGRIRIDDIADIERM